MEEIRHLQKLFVGKCEGKGEIDRLRRKLAYKEESIKLETVIFRGTLLHGSGLVYFLIRYTYCQSLVNLYVLK
jgi:hypothetical protein